MKKLPLLFTTFLLTTSGLRAAEIILPQNRSAFYAKEAIEVAVSGSLAAPAVVEFVPMNAGFATVKFTLQPGKAIPLATLPPFTLAPGEYSVRLNGQENTKITVSDGVLSSPMLTSQTYGTGDLARSGGNFYVANAFNFGLVDGDGKPLSTDLQGRRSPGMLGFENAIRQNYPSLLYMYWTGFVTHKPWGTEKSWANTDVAANMRLFNFHMGQRLRRNQANLLSVGTLDEPGLAWGKTPAGGLASGFPNWDEQPWYEARGWKYTNDIAKQSDADFMKYMDIRTGIIRENNFLAKHDLKAALPNVPFSTDLYAPQAIMDGTDPLSQEVNAIPASHVFLDWGTGKAGIIGALYLEKAHDPAAKIAHAANGQLFGAGVPQPQQRYAYHLTMNGMLAAGLHSNWWLNAGLMSPQDLAAVNEPVQRWGGLFDGMTPIRHDTAILWSYTEAAMRQKDMAAKESTKKDGEQIKLMVAAMPENTALGDKGELAVNAYSIGGNYKEQVLNVHQTLSRAGYPTHILHEKILPRGVLKNYKTLVVVGQTFTLPAEVRTAIADFVRQGGRIVTDRTTTQSFPGSIVTEADFRDPHYRWGALFGAPEDKFKTMREASTFKTNWFMDERNRTNVKPMLAAMAKTASRPVFTTDSVHLCAERHYGGEGQLLMVLNANDKLPDIAPTERHWIYNYAPLQATYTLRDLPRGAVVYEVSGLDWKQVKRLATPEAPQNAAFEPGEMKLYIVAPRRPARLNLATWAKDGQIVVRAAIPNLKMPWPLTVTIQNPAGQTLFRTYRGLNDSGRFEEEFPIGENAAPGAYLVTVESPLEDLKAQARAGWKTGAAQIVQSPEGVRVFDESAIRQFLTSKPEVSVIYGTENYRSAAEQLATALAAKGVSAKAQPESSVLRRALYPRVWNPFVRHYKVPTGTPAIPGDLAIERKLQMGWSDSKTLETKTETGETIGLDWRQPKSLVTITGTGYTDYRGQDGETVYDPGVVLYVDAQKQVRVLNGTAEMEAATPEFKAHWSHPWTRLETYNGGFQLPPQLPEAYEVPGHVILLGDSTNSELIAALQASELLPQLVDAKYPGPGHALVSFAWSPFAVEKNAILVGASDSQGLDAGMARLLALLK